jgi:ketosteroid isomerase-like protein
VPAENVETMRAVFDALNRGDWDGALAHMAPDFEYDLTRTISPLAGVYGRAQMRRVVQEFLGPWQDVRYEAEEPIEAGDTVVIPFTTHFKGRAGIEVSSAATWVCEFRQGKVVRSTLFQDIAEALAFAGVET